MRLETRRLILREFELQDFEHAHAYGSDPEVVRFMEWGPNTADQTREFLNRKIERRGHDPRMEYELAVELKENRKVIGGVGMRLTRPAHREGDVGYTFNRTYWGLGYCTEAASAMVEFGFSQLGLHRIFATCDPENRASARVMEKLGMSYEGRIRHHLWQKETWRDSLIYAILESDPRRAVE